MISDENMSPEFIKEKYILVLVEPLVEVWVQDGRLKIILLLEIRSQEVGALAIHLQLSLGDKFFKA